MNATRNEIERTFETSTHNSQSCEICGALPADLYPRNQTAREIPGVRYVRTRQNRRRVSNYWSTPTMAARLVAAGCTPDWAGRLACLECLRRVGRALNA